MLIAVLDGEKMLSRNAVAYSSENDFKEARCIGLEFLTFECAAAASAVSRLRRPYL